MNRQTFTVAKREADFQPLSTSAGAGGNESGAPVSITDPARHSRAMTVSFSWIRPTATPKGNEPESELKAWGRLARRARTRWARENAS